MSDKTDKDPEHIPESDRPGRNSQQYNALRKQDEVDPSDYPKKDRDAADLTGKDQ